uniref:ParE toxin of type II toxin-antitoxin system, parDE n=1 Tax=Candidatus Kentrum sp. LFY TaxID=2126342 RepID=A0A450UVG9_9GAMM|nr:MAG: hypothetical protein BECKLFY1418B_GA0070995_103823 [Candidatus Kentron sp. LFY]VFJ96539.1 MAG: hypothetical protein BECKLFY1418A_GA0070994_106016 [Candidatus Kentron sp. LFY]
MQVRINYTDRSKEDVEAAFRWYEMQRGGLGSEFLDCVEYPMPTFVVGVIGRFPFSISYTIEGEEIVIHSILDNQEESEKGFR